MQNVNAVPRGPSTVTTRERICTLTVDQSQRVSTPYPFLNSIPVILHDAQTVHRRRCGRVTLCPPLVPHIAPNDTHTKRHAKILDRKSTRLNSSHTVISYAVFCL